jgi:hypothetical protein
MYYGLARCWLKGSDCELISKLTAYAMIIWWDKSISPNLYMISLYIYGGTVGISLIRIKDLFYQLVNTYVISFYI